MFCLGASWGNPASFAAAFRKLARGILGARWWLEDDRIFMGSRWGESAVRIPLDFPFRADVIFAPRSVLFCLV